MIRAESRRFADVGEYWILHIQAHGIERESWYCKDCVCGSTIFRVLATRFRTEGEARDARTLHCHGSKIVHIRIRPRSERLYLCERLAAWEPVVRAVQELVSSRPTLRKLGALRPLFEAWDSVEEEHRP